MSAEMAEQSLPYEEVTDPSYAQRAAGSFTVEWDGTDAIILYGRCPRCRALIEVPLFADLVRSAQPTVAQTRPATVICTCEEEHPARPAQRVGCGAYWTLNLELGE